MREWVESSLLTLKLVSEADPRTQKERGSGSETILKHTPFGVNKLIKSNKGASEEGDHPCALHLKSGTVHIHLYI